MKRPTHELIKRLANLENCTYGRIAQSCGKSIQTAEAWGRPPESDEHPYGTGKKNPLDCVDRLLALAHHDDPGLSREMAEHFTDTVDALEGKAPEVTGSINSLIGQSAKEHLDIMLLILNSARPDWKKAFTEVKQAQAALYRVELFVKAEMQEVA